MKDLAAVFDVATVKRLAGPRAYSRGVSYARDRRVERPEVRDGRLKATVRGTMPYLVELWDDGGGPKWSCSCPAAEDGSFCKHCVAAALSLGVDESSGVDGGPVLVPVAGRGLPEGGDFEPVPNARDELAGFLEGLGPERLAEVVLEAAESDWRLQERLLAEARAARGAKIDLAGWRRRIDRAFADPDYMFHGFVTYQTAAGWAASVDEMIDAVEDLCDSGHHDAAARLAEHAHRRADEAVDYVDDSDGWITVISERLSDLHLRACEEGPPEVSELAARLVEMELASELGGFYRSAATYAEILGETGLAAFREHLEPHRERVERKAASDKYSSEVFAWRQAMVGWAHGTGDPEALIEAHSHGSMLADDMLEIARALDRAGRGDEAVAWARRGMADWSGRPHQLDGLRDFLALKMRGRGDDKAAVELFWQAFVAAPSLSAYRRLLDEGPGEDWLRRCRDHLRRVLEGVPRSDAAPLAPEAAFGPLPPRVPLAAGALMEILMYEGLAEAAWGVARQHGCGSQMWLTIARALENTRPLDSIAVYEPAALAIIDAKKADRYQSAVDLMVRIRRLADSAGKPRRFESLLSRVRTEHKAKRKLKSLLDAQGW